MEENLGAEDRSIEPCVVASQHLTHASYRCVVISTTGQYYENSLLQGARQLSSKVKCASGICSDLYAVIRACAPRAEVILHVSGSSKQMDLAMSITSSRSHIEMEIDLKKKKCSL